MRTAAIRNQPPTTLQRLTDRFADLRARVRRRLATRPNAIQTTTGAELLDLRSPHPHWIVGRGLCMYRREDFSNVPRNKRRAAVELRIPVWSPFRRTGHHSVWAGGVAMVWFWDSDKVHVGDELFGTPAAADAGVRVVPETVFHPTRPDGIHLQACHEGCELQRWRDDILEDAFWFPTRPAEQDIAWFQARTGDAEAHLPAELLPAPAIPLLRDPWSSALSPREWFEVNETALVAAAVLLLWSCAGASSAPRGSRRGHQFVAICGREPGHRRCRGASMRARFAGTISGTCRCWCNQASVSTSRCNADNAAVRVSNVSSS